MECSLSIERIDRFGQDASNMDIWKGLKLNMEMILGTAYLSITMVG